MKLELPPCPEGLQCRAELQEPLPEGEVFEAVEDMEPELLGTLDLGNSPASGRLSRIYLDPGGDGRRWLLWDRMFDDWVHNAWTWRLAAWAPAADAPLTVAAMHLAVAALRGERKYYGTERWGRIEPGLLTVAQWDIVGREVWGGEEPPETPVVPPTVYGSVDVAARANVQVGWLCSLKWIGRFVLCLECGEENRPVDSLHGHSRPLHIDEVRPQPQTCVRCKRVMVEGVLPHAPERHRGGRWRSEREGG